MDERSLSPSDSDASPLHAVLKLHLALCDGGRLGSVIPSCVAPDGSFYIQIILTLDQPRRLTGKRLQTQKAS